MPLVGLGATVKPAIVLPCTDKFSSLTNLQAIAENDKSGFGMRSSKVVHTGASSLKIAVGSINKGASSGVAF